MNPDREAKRCRGSASDAAHQTRHSLSGIQFQLLAVCPRQRAGVSSRVKNDLIEHDSAATAATTKLCADHRQGFAGIGRVVGELGPTHPIWFILSPNTDDIGMLGCLMRGMEHNHRTSS